MIVFFELFHFKNVIVVVIDHLLNLKKFDIMNLFKSICRTLSIGAALTFLGNIVLMVGDCVGIEGELANSKTRK